MDDHLGPCQPDPEKSKEASDPSTGRNMSLTQCYCDGCKNSFYVEGNSVEFLPKMCCYCGSTFGECEEITEELKDDENEQWGYELFA